MTRNEADEAISFISSSWRCINGIMLTKFEYYI